MNFDEIKPGMVFKENDNRFTRYVRVEAVATQGTFSVTLSSGFNAKGPFVGRTVSRKAARFHREPRSKGYSLVAER